MRMFFNGIKCSAGISLLAELFEALPVPGLCS